MTCRLQLVEYPDMINVYRLAGLLGKMPEKLERKLKRKAEYVEIAEARIGVLIRSPLVQREEK